MKPMTIALILLLVAGLGLGMVLILPKQKTDPPAAEAPPVNVEVEIVRPVPEMDDPLNLPGVVEPNQVVHVAAEVAGRVKRVAVEEGQFCRAGTPLIYLNDDLLKAEYERAAAQADFDRKEYARVERLFRQGVPTEKERDQAAARRAVSSAALDEAAARLARTVISMPIDGVLNDVPVDEGEYVQPGTTVAEVVDMKTAKVVIYVPEKDVHFVQVGRDATIRATARDEEQTLRGQVTLVSELAEERTRTTRVEIAVPNGERLLRSGQIVEVVMVRRTLADVIMIPLRAVIPLENGKLVYVEKAGRADRREVSLGFLRGRRVRVLAGLQTGDRLIVEGHRYVSPGQSVKVEQVSEAPAGPSPQAIN